MKLNLGLEKKALKEVNGKFLITSTTQFSSSGIINEKLAHFSDHKSEWLKKIKASSSKSKYLSDFDKALKKLKNQKILIIGEIIYDEYNYVEPLGKPSKENILSVNFKNQETFLGGCLPVVKIYRKYVKILLY